MTLRSPSSIESNHCDSDVFKTAIITLFDLINRIVIKIARFRKFPSEAQERINALLFKDIAVGCVDVSIEGSQGSS